MKSIRVILAFFLVLSVSVDSIEAVESALLYHLPFEDFKFLQEDFLAPSELKSIEDRGLTLEQGRFGKGLKMNKTPHWDELFNNSGVDLDMLTAVEFNSRMSKRHGFIAHNEPFLWGAGKIVPRAGAVAFWVKGPLMKGMLFNQSAMAWGRSEKDLLSITVDKNLQVGACIIDSRYIFHTIQSQEPWNAEKWNHVVLNWDNALGLELFVNGKSIASSWGTDAWWETPLSGLLHFPMPHVVYDEFYSFSRPLTSQEIMLLIEKNIALASTPAAGNTRDAGDRLACALGIMTDSNLPVIRPMDKGSVLSFKEITPAFMGDGNIPARLCQDGRYELAWPLRIGSFTIIPGDGIFPAEKLEIVSPQGIPYNYITLEGNLSDLPNAITDCKKVGDRYTGTTYFTIPQDGRFFYGTVLERTCHPIITLPFLHGYGEADGYTGTVNLPITRDTRVHEVGLFDVREEDDVQVSGEMVYYLCSESMNTEKRYGFAMRTLLPQKEKSTLWGYRTIVKKNREWIETGYLQRSNIVTAPVTGEKCIGSIVLDLLIKTESPEDILLVRLRDPVLPHRIWTHAEVKLVGFNGDGARLRLKLVPPALMLEAGDIIWLDVATRNNALIRIGDSGDSRIVLKPASYFNVERKYELKAMMPAMAEKMFCHYRPWLFVNRRPDVLNPYTLGGQYDAVMPALATKRAMPQSRLADYYLTLSGIDQQYWQTYQTVSGKKTVDSDMSGDIPRWAYLQHIIMNFRYRVVDWMIEHQNDDGQLGEGWNDDVFILTGKSDIPLDGYSGAREMYLNVFRGIDETNILGDGFCQISPIDTLHIYDFCCERWRSIPYMLGDPYVIRRSLKTAWHADKPEKTPVNYAAGIPYTYEKNILSWYWNVNYPAKIFESRDEQSLTETLAKTAVFCDDIHLFQYTEAWNPSYNLPNENIVIPMIIGGWERYFRFPTEESRAICIAWPEGGGEDLARWVTYGDSKTLECRMFSFDPLPRCVTAQPYMLDSGTYEITLFEESGGKPGVVLFTKKQKMKRFDTFSFEVPSFKPVILTVKQIKRDKNQGPFPDLAIAGYDCERDGSNLRVRVSNVGAAPSKKTSLVIYDDRGKKITEKAVPVIKAPLDYVEKSVMVEFSGIPSSRSLRILVDEKNKIEELYEGNNKIVIE